MRALKSKSIPADYLLFCGALLLIFLGVMWEYIPGIWVRILVLACGIFMLFLVIC